MKRYQQNPNFIFRKIAEEVVLVPIHKDVADMACIYSLNSMGAFIWSKMADLVTKKEILLSILDEFDVHQIDAEQDLDEFIDEMMRLGAVEEFQL